MNCERRVFSGSELRVGNSQGDEWALVGYASIFNSLSHDLGGFREVVAPGAFTRALKENQDVRCLWNHSTDKILGRTSAGTLRLEQDRKGLLMRCQLDPAQQFHRDLYAAVKRGDVREMSFAFAVPKDSNGEPTGEQWDTVDDDSADNTDRSQPSRPARKVVRRTLTDVDLFDVSPVVYPAYQATTLAARAAATALETLSNESWRRLVQMRLSKLDEVMARDRAALEALELQERLHQLSADDLRAEARRLAEVIARDFAQETRA
jgi:uncharacterized protein